MAFDMSCRPSELLNLRIRDLQFKINNEGFQYAEVEIKGGKTGSRIIPLIDSILFHMLKTGFKMLTLQELILIHGYLFP